MLRKALKITGIIFFLLIGFAFAIPYLFKGKILSLIKKELNQQITATVDFSDLDVSLFRSFPRLSAGLDQVRVLGTGNFLDDTIFAARRVDVALNLLSVMDGNNLKIYSVTLEEPRINAVINKEGKANWDISKPDSSPTDNTGSSGFQLDLDHYSIRNAYIKYTDIPGKMSAEISNLNHSGRGNFKEDNFTLHTLTEAGVLNFVYEGIPYLVDAHAMIKTDLQVESATQTYRFKTDEISINDLTLNTEGFFQLVNDSTY